MWTVLWNSPSPLLQWGVVIAASFAAAIVDTYKHRIPNWLTGCLFVGGIIFASVTAGGKGAVDSVLACIILALPYMILYILAGGGAGDAKMMGAIGAWLGIVNGLCALVAVSIAGVVLGIVFLVYRRGISSVAPAANAGALNAMSFVFSKGKTLKNINKDENKPEPLAKMPYGLAIMTGMILAAVGVWVFRNL